MMARSGIITSVSSRWRVGASSRGGPPVFVLRQPNMRLKLAGLSLLKESEWFAPLAGTGLSSTASCAGGLAARSLSAIR